MSASNHGAGSESNSRLTVVYDPYTEEYQFQNEDDDDDGDDMDYAPAVEAFDEPDEDDDDESEFLDAETAASGVDIEFEIPGTFPADDEVTTEGSRLEDQEDTQTLGEPPSLRISRAQLLQLLNNNGGLRAIWGHALLPINVDNDEHDGSDTSVGAPRARWGFRRRFRTDKPEAPFEPVPNENGTKLMESGMFGTNERPEDSMRRKKNATMRLLRRELGLGTPGRELANGRLLRQDLLPSSKADMIINYNRKCYSGQFSKDGNFFFSCAQDMNVRMYDTSNPYDWRYFKTVAVHMGNWTITDATLSPDNRFLAASSIRNIVTLAPTDPMSSLDDDFENVQHLDFARTVPGTNTGPRQFRGWRGHSHFGIWSLRFSGDGKEIVAGTGDCSVYVHDIETEQSILRIPGHSDDVNAVCYGDEMSPHILFSGSDDSTLKVWDRRSLGDGRPAGVFVGHVEGLTYVDAKGDGRYVLSNGKDQTTKLWDLRKVVATEKADLSHLSNHTFDYRTDEYPFSEWQPHPDDCSLVTFRGHRILRTLIRCHFSPPGSTDGRYVYSGSQDGRVWIWNLDGTVKKTIDVYKETFKTRAQEQNSPDDYYWDYSDGNWKTVVRDASWHPHMGMIAATSWNGYGCAWGTCTVHSWHDGDEEENTDRPTDSSRPSQTTAKMVNPTLRDFSQGANFETRRRRTRIGRRTLPLSDSDEETDGMLP